MSIIPGFLAITRKTSLVRSLRSVYGDEGAWGIVPRTFKLPEEMDEWAGEGGLGLRELLIVGMDEKAGAVRLGWLAGDGWGW